MSAMVELALPASDRDEVFEAGTKVEVDMHQDIELRNRRQKRLSKRAKQRQAESTDSIVCPKFDFDKKNARLNKPDGSRTTLTKVLEAACFASSISWQWVAIVQGAYTGTGPRSSFMALSQACYTGFTFLTPFLIDYFRRVIRSGEHLDCLGAGRVMISTREEKNLQRWRKLLRIPKLFFRAMSVCVFSVCIFLFTFMGEMLRGGNFHTWCAFMAIMSTMAVVLNAMPLIFDWWLSLKVTSALASHATAEVLIAAEEVSPKDTDWESRVVDPAKKLALDIMDELTHGWGRALAVAYGIFWILALAFFANILLDSEKSDIMAVIMRFFMLGMVVVGVAVPLAMTIDPASVSTSCDDLLTELNARRCELLGDDAAINKIMQLEDVSTSASACLRLLHTANEH
jgi:hypothetical protein